MKNSLIVELYIMFTYGVICVLYYRYFDFPINAYLYRDNPEFNNHGNGHAYTFYESVNLSKEGEYLCIRMTLLNRDCSCF